MPGPGSSDALVLPSLSDEMEPPAETGARITPELEVFLDGTKYSSVAVAHGLSPSASTAFELGKRRRSREQGVIWVTDPDLPGHLTGDNAALLWRLLKRKGTEVMSFFSVRAQRVTAGRTRRSEGRSTSITCGHGRTLREMASMRPMVTVAATAALMTSACNSSEERAELNAPETFGSSYEILEQRRGKSKAAPPDGTLVDYESEITVRPDRAALSRVIGIGRGDDPTLSGSEIEVLDARIASAEEWLRGLDQVQDVVARIAEYESELLDYFAIRDKPEILGGESRFREVAAQRGRIVDDLTTLAKIYTEAVTLDRKVEWEFVGDRPPDRAVQFRRDEERLTRVRNAMVPNSRDGRESDSPSLENSFDAAEVTRVINATTSVLRDRIEEIEWAILEKAPKAKLDMEAVLFRGGSTLAVTIAPYRIVAGENRGAKSPRIGIPSKADHQRVRRVYDQYNAMAASLNELQRIGRDPVARRKLIEGFLESIENAAKEFLKDTRDDLAKAAEFAEPEVAAVKEAAEVLLVDVERVVDAVDELRSSTDPLVVAERAAALLRFVAGEEFRGHLTALRDSIPEKLPQGLSDEAAKLLPRLKENLAAQVDKLAAALRAQPGGGEIASLLTSLEALREIAQTRAFEDLEDGRITRRSFSIETAQDGIIDLERTQADDGDRLSIDYRLIVHPGTKDERTHSVSSSLDVRKFGLYTSYEAQLIFYDRLGDGSSAYQAAPGIAYNFHYRPESAQDVFDVVAPGVGFNVSSPSFESGADLAVGVQVTLFQNLFQAGYAYNISVEDDPEMFFFGLDLISAFRAVE